VRRVERWLATARLFLAISALVAINVDRSVTPYSVWAFGLLAFYIAQGMIIIIFLRRRQESTPSFRLLVHSADILWPALISIFAADQSNPFFLFFVFVLAAAAYRWGLWETVGTACAAVLLLWVEHFTFQWGLVLWLDQVLPRYHLPKLLVDTADFEPKRLFMRSVYLLVMGLLLGYLAEQQKQLRTEKTVIARVLSGVRVEAGLGPTLQQILSYLSSMHDGKSALIATNETGSNHIFVGEVRSVGASSPSFTWRDASSSDREVYLTESEVNACYLDRGEGSTEAAKFVALNRDGARLRGAQPDFLGAFAERHSFRSVATITFLFGREWWGRIFLMEASLGGDTEEELRFMQELVRHVGPAVYNVYLLRRLRRRAGSVERQRFSRELHDGAVQSLIAVEMQVDVLRRQAGAKPYLVPDELGRIQGLLRDEVLKLRELMQQWKSLDLDSRRLLVFLGDTVERFQRETGITAHFHSDLDELEMPQYVCRELVRIIQEGLVNVRKHSRARQVVVRLGSHNGSWNVVIEDDGCGFPFSGRLSDEELEKIGKGPVVIRERVRLIEGELTVESVPGQGSRLEIKVPQKREAAHG
jgi:signal transduction histidine kinase